ncbi:hypothetical protein A35_08380 [Coxiella burnetii 'MSU Goat Q177']|nr:hypothetical protein A35_08380 [Coxiella burnetii 'MSU Goat Q177']
MKCNRIENRPLMPYHYHQPQPFNFRLIIPGCGTSSALLARSTVCAGSRLRGDDGVFWKLRLIEKTT